jgi:hypothetical protein
MVTARTDDAVEILFGVIEDGLADVQPRRRDRDVQPRKCLHHRRRERSNVFRICRVAGRGFRRTSLRANAGGGRFRALARPIGGYDAIQAVSTPRPG